MSPSLSRAPSAAAPATHSVHPEASPTRAGIAWISLCMPPSFSAGNQAFNWIGSNAFNGVAGELRAFQSGGNWIVQGDTDGDGNADLVVSVVAQGGVPLIQSDFLL